MKYKLLIYILIYFIVSPSNSFGTESYTQFKTEVEEKIKTFSNIKIISKQADNTLSKLISAKSPIILSWLDKRNLNSKSENDIVREWREYYARNFILTKYPHNIHSIDLEIEKLVESVNSLFASKEFKKKMQDLFLKSKEASISTLKSFPIQEIQKKKILSRIESIQLYWMKDFKGSKFKELPLDFLDWGIAYDPASNEINMGINALSYPNEETYLSVFSHEIGHSFDSCRWGAFFEGEWPFQKIGQCLRSLESVGAKARDDSNLDAFIKEGKVPADLGVALKLNPTCNKMVYPTVGIQADQLPESFADWFSAETMSSIKNINYLNIRTDLNKSKDLIPGSSYPSNELRVDNIYFAHPKLRIIRDSLKSKKVKYCGWI